jgi:spoIIIJ-associated protein
MDNLTQAAQTIGQFLQAFTVNSGLRLRFRVKVRNSASSEDSLENSGSANDSSRSLLVEFSGPDTQILTAHNAEVLDALEHIAIKILRVEADGQDRITFDADNFKLNRDRIMRDSALAAIERVRSTGKPFPFAPMNSRDRRLLHILLRDSRLPTASSGEGPGRFVVLYPEGTDVSAPPAIQDNRGQDAGRIRQAFRHR